MKQLIKILLGIAGSMLAIFTCLLLVAYLLYSNNFNAPWLGAEIFIKSPALYNSVPEEELDCIELVTKDVKKKITSTDDLVTTKFTVEDLSFLQWLRYGVIHVNVKHYVNEDILRKELSKVMQKEPVPAKFEIDPMTGKTVYIAESAGFSFDIEDVVDFVMQNNGKNTLQFDITSVCKVPDVQKTENANTAIERMGHLQEAAIMCDGNNLLEGKYDQIVNANYTVSANDLLVDELTNAVITSLEYGNDHTRFTSHTGKIISVPNKTWLLLVNKEVEREKIKQAILSLTPYDASDAQYVSTYGGEIGDTYVEVDITTQEVFHYVNGLQCCYSPIVTGHAGRHDTPIGVYFVSECIPGKYLVGDTYRTWVDRWMRLTNSGIGLHDASWRGTFGGNIYQSNGSHGCINLPKNYAYRLYNEITVGTPVVIHN